MLSVTLTLTVLTLIHISTNAKKIAMSYTKIASNKKIAKCLKKHLSVVEEEASDRLHHHFLADFFVIFFGIGGNGRLPSNELNGLTSP